MQHIHRHFYQGVREAVWPAWLGQVVPVADQFQHREVEVLLESVGGADAAVVLTHVLGGMGGVGKTQLAAAYAHGMWSQQRVDLLVWVTAATRPGIIAAYAQAAYAILNDVEEEVDKAAIRFLTWLATTDRRGWWCWTTCRPQPI